MYLISACLCGVNCKYSGKNNFNKDCMKLLEEDQALLVCPEQLGGMSTPRKPAEIKGNALDIIEKKEGMVINEAGEDVTEYFVKGAQEVVNIAKNSGIMAAILKENSPSCGCNYIYDGTFSGKKIEGSGITCEMLKKSGIEVISDEEFSQRLKDEDTLIRLSDYDYKRKNSEVKNEEDCISSEGNLYSILDSNYEEIDELPPAVEKQMKRLAIVIAKEMYGMQNVEEISESTRLSEEEIESILKDDE